MKWGKSTQGSITHLIYPPIPDMTMVRALCINLLPCIKMIPPLSYSEDNHCSVMPVNSFECFFVAVY